MYPGIHFPIFSGIKVLPKIFPLQIWLKFFGTGNWQKFFLKGKGLQDDEEKETINRSGMEMALGVYPNGQ